MDKKKKGKGYFFIALIAILLGAVLIWILLSNLLNFKGRMTDSTMMRNAELLATAAYKTDALPTGGQGGVYYYDAARNMLTSSDAGIVPYGEQTKPTDHTNCIIRVTITDENGTVSIDTNWYIKAQTIS